MRTIHPHHDALIVTLGIGVYKVKRVMADQESRVEIMYPDLFKGLGLTSKDLTKYDTPLIGFNRKMVILKGMIRLPMQTRNEIVELDFIVMDAYFPYTAILARVWLHFMGVILSALHLKVNYSSERCMVESLGYQTLGRHYLMAAIKHKALQAEDPPLDKSL